MSLATMIHSRQDAAERLIARDRRRATLIARNAEIVRLKRSNLRDDEIASRLNIGVTTVSKIHVGRT